MYDEKLDYDQFKKYGGELCSVFYQIYYHGFCQYCNLQYCPHSLLPPGPEYQVKVVLNSLVDITFNDLLFQQKIFFKEKASKSDGY